MLEATAEPIRLLLNADTEDEKDRLTTCWSVRAIWYSSLVLVLKSVSLATQQSIALYHLSSHPRGLQMAHNLLSQDPGADINVPLQPRIL